MIKNALPWSVKYNQRFPEWDEFSQPSIVDADGEFVCDMHCGANHPGERDQKAIDRAKLIVEAVNC